MTRDLSLADRNRARTRGHLAVAMVTRWPMTAIYRRHMARPGRASDPALRLNLRGEGGGGSWDR